MSTSARFPSGNSPFQQGQDNTSRIKTNQYFAPVYATPLTFAATKANTVIFPSDLTGALTINLGVGTALTAPFVGDEVRYLFTSVSGATVTLGSGILGASASIIIPATKTANINFMFNGTSWVEIGRVVTI